VPKAFEFLKAFQNQQDWHCAGFQSGGAVLSTFQNFIKNLFLLDFINGENAPLPVYTIS
jgi:hypothetical protein